MSDEKAKELAELLKVKLEEIEGWTKEQAMDYLVKLGTHHPDGTLTKEYGGKC